MSKRVAAKYAAVVLGAVLSAGVASTAFAGHYSDNNWGCCSRSFDRTCHDSTYCGYQVGVVPAGKCAPMRHVPDSTFCGYLVGTYPAGKCVYGHACSR